MVEVFQQFTMSSGYIMCHSRPYFGALRYGIVLIRNEVDLQKNLGSRTFGGFSLPTNIVENYRMHRVNKAVEQMSDTTDQDGETEDSERAGSLLKKNRFSDGGQVTGSIERMVEAVIHQSIEKGDFKDLPGMGKPLPPKEVSPFIDIGQYNLNRVLVNNGAAPEFVTIDREVKDLFSESKSKLFRERFKLGLEPLNKFNQKKMDHLVVNFRKEMETINKKIVNFNLYVPSLRLQKFQLNPDREAEKVIEGYKEYEKEMLASLERRRSEKSAADDKTYGWSSVSQITETLFNTVLGQSSK